MKNIFFLLLLLTCLLLPQHARAITSMSVTPPVTEVLISPNKSVSTTLQISNEGDDSSIILSLHKVIPTDDQGHTTIDPKPLALSNIPLVIKLVGADLGVPFTLNAGQSKAITLQLDAANLDEPTDVYFALLARSIGTNLSPTKSQTSPGITALFMTTITPSASLPTNIALLPPDLPIVQDTYLPLNTSVIAENKTGIMLQVQGKIKLSSPNNTVIKESTFDPKLVLGNTTRMLSTITLPLSPYYLGPHTLTIELTTVGGRTLTEHSYIIWFLPLRYILIVIVTLILFSIPLIRKINLTKRVTKA